MEEIIKFIDAILERTIGEENFAELKKDSERLSFMRVVTMYQVAYAISNEYLELTHPHGHNGKGQ